MKSEWQDKEPGPECTCGCPTFVSAQEGQLPMFVCILHSWDAGVCYPLPKERPENWPNLTNEELTVLVNKGFEEHEIAEKKES